ncbi:exodeoxyribonuclease VII large subunit [Rheinheimera sp. 4Y26]|uniref:exodeoxyribonuclease VII large subunit n=1 Tax=Rheinheimera sp. 4Y26 TaxID=2977811 RepID=UPI0021B100E3|nr:exodeoxyribonuclease VII large subunit [Rheinheimera sp. 4Y26]MCT6698544.1 exodeoxyribonuclease VII large subunit [Rheinheimera sp. 4Y26]
MQQADIYTVSRLNSEVRLTLELQFRQLWLVGEVSNFVAASSGHWYFSLKDQAAQVKVAMFKTSNRNAVFTPRNGQQVMVRARISVYEPRGEYQLLADFIEPAGDGLLRQQYEQLKAKLAAEGLFAPERKKALPQNAQKIGVITSPTGAAIRDILTVLQRRAPALEVIIYPSLVQGAQAASDLTAALQHAIRRNECDVLIIGRGGGSLEDMWCFNDETLARTIANCPIAIVSAVGHEIDFSISDFVADVRAATPSAAAELVSPDQQHQLRTLLQLKQRLMQSIRQQLGQKAQLFLHQHAKLQLLHPARRLQQQQQRLDELQIRLQQAIQHKLQRQRQQLLLQQKALWLLSPEQQLKRQHLKLQQLQQRLERSLKQQLQKKQQQWQALSRELHTVSPLATLQRGYSIVFDANSTVVKSASQLQSGDKVRLKLADGDIAAEVTAVSIAPSQ